MGKRIGGCFPRVQPEPGPTGEGQRYRELTFAEWCLPDAEGGSGWRLSPTGAVRPRPYGEGAEGRDLRCLASHLGLMHKNIWRLSPTGAAIAQPNGKGQCESMTFLPGVVLLWTLVWRWHALVAISFDGPKRLTSKHRLVNSVVLNDSCLSNE